MDNDCVKDKKCCSNGCYSICVAPAEENLVPAAAGTNKESDCATSVSLCLKMGTFSNIDGGNANENVLCRCLIYFAVMSTGSICIMWPKYRGTEFVRTPF